MNKRIALTGGSGHLGYHIGKVLIEKKYNVLLLLRRHNAYTHELIRKGAKFKIVNFHDVNNIKNALKNYKVLINTASKYSKFENISIYISSIIEYQYNKKKASYPSTWYRESDNLEILENFKNNISKDNNIKLLGHHSWIQNIPEFNESKYLRFKNNDFNYGFYIKLYKKRFLHLDLKSFINQKGNNGIKIFIDKEHRIFNEEIYLFDHPEFGILFSINKI